MSRPINVLELRSVRGTGGGPEKTILLGAARSNPRDVRVTVCYIRDARDAEFRIDKRARALGVDYVEVTERHSFDPGIWPQLCRIVRDRQIDIVHAHEHKTDLLALLLARAQNIVPIATAHGWSGTSVKEGLYYFVDRRLLPRYPMVIAVSEPIRQTILKRGAQPGRVRRLPNGIDHADFRRDPSVRGRVRSALGIAEDAIVIGGVGRLEAVKRFDVLLAALARLPNQPLAMLVGEGSAREQLSAQATALGVADRLRLTGHREDARELHQALDVYVQSSDSEGIPNAVLEAMALETPVVATDVGGTREVIANEIDGLLTPRRDPDALAGAIVRTLGDPGATARRVAAARARIECELSFDARNKALEAIYQELVAGRGRANVA
ncbi:MAG TPA: glycosyltransferase [Vicinamibacterales bacterium]